jgi:hypothetical protein
VFNYQLISGLLNLPESASHVQMRIHLLALPDFTWNGNKYKPTSPPSPLLTLESEITARETPLVWQGAHNLNFSGSYALCFSLSFYQQINGESHPLAAHPFSWNAIL